MAINLKLNSLNDLRELFRPSLKLEKECQDLRELVANNFREIEELKQEIRTLWNDKYQLALRLPSSSDQENKGMTAILRNIIQGVRNNDDLMVVKEIHTLTGLSLKECKDLIKGSLDKVEKVKEIESKEINCPKCDDEKIDRW